ncbi:MAG: T9SS type A sorting domain-containing protein [Rhodothermales bacterium]|nr:T9SS type A sorting domain-containing protein [Rhodothermales bacterium]
MAFVRIIGCVACLVALCTPGARAQDGGPRPGARMAFPSTGEVSALVVFIQFEDEPDGAGAFGDDPATEWPHGRSLGPERRLPAWAEGNRLLAPPGTAPEAFDPGSLSAFYHLMSHGRFTVTGRVAPRVYVPEHPVDWYHAHRGGLPNGAVRLARDVLTAPEIRSFVDGLPDRRAFDRITNGTDAYAPDGRFDLVVLVHRDLVLPRLRRDDAGRPQPGSSVTSLGADPAIRLDDPADYRDPATDALAAAPVVLGGLRVTDNLTSGSGVTVYALTRKQAVRAIAHEIGHRHFGFYHTCDSPLAPVADCLGLMTGASLTMSAGDRIKLGWAEVVDVALPPTGRVEAVFPDALASGQVFRLRLGPARCGDVIVEARFWTNFFDAPPNPGDPTAPFPGNDDADDADLFLPEEGLYLYKAPEAGNSLCGGRRDAAYDEQLYSSMENNRLGRRLQPFQEGPARDLRAFITGGTYRTAYGPGDVYAPFTQPLYFFHPHPALDERLALTAIERRDGAFAAEIWTDYLAGPPEENRLTVSAYPNPFTSGTTLRYETATTEEATVEIFDGLGRRVATLAEGLHQPGLHEVRFYAPDTLAAGRYWARIRAGRRTTTVPLTYVR